MEAYRRPRPQTFDRRPRASLFERAGFNSLDPWLLFAGIALIAFSIYTLGVATSEDVPGNPYYYVVRQSIYAVVGIALMFGMARLDYSRFRELRVGIYTAMIGMIILVLMLGEATRGSRRWIELPFFTFQPSELGQAAPGHHARGVRDRPLAPQRFGHSPNDSPARARAVPRGPRLHPAGPRHGARLRRGHARRAVHRRGAAGATSRPSSGAPLALIAIVLVIAPAVGVPILADYQQDRLTAFLHPSDDPADSSYQINQALIAVGSGGKTGRGDDATQTNNGFLPERHTDFIFAVVGERFGFVGAAFLLSLYALLIWRALRTMTLSKNLYGSMIAGGIAAMLMFQVFVNVGMNVGIMPITGIPLPLMSSGGSSVIVTFLALGLLQSIYVQAQLSSRAGLNSVLR